MRTETLVPVLVALVAAIAAMYSARRSWQSSSKANEISSRKVDAEVYEQARSWYQKQLDDADRVVERVRRELDRALEQIAQERQLSRTLEGQVAVLSKQVHILESTVAQLSSGRHAGPPPPIPPG